MLLTSTGMDGAQSALPARCLNTDNTLLLVRRLRNDYFGAIGSRAQIFLAFAGGLAARLKKKAPDQVVRGFFQILMLIIGYTNNNTWPFLIN
jgi:hypothetical protein